MINEWIYPFPSTVLCLVNLGTLSAIIYQLRKNYVQMLKNNDQMNINNAIKQGEFICSINDTLIGFTDLLTFVRQNNIEQPCEKIKTDAQSYLSVFETILHLYDKGIISKEDFKLYFGGRLGDFFKNDTIKRSCSDNPEFKDLCKRLEPFIADTHPDTKICDR